MAKSKRDGEKSIYLFRAVCVGLISLSKILVFLKYMKKICQLQGVFPTFPNASLVSELF